MTKPNPFTFRDFYIRSDQRANAASIAATLVRFVPSGKLAPEWTEEVVKLLRANGVRPGVIFQVLEVARRSGSDFPPLYGNLYSQMMLDPQWAALEREKTARQPPSNVHASLGPPPDPATYRRGLSMEIRRLEQKFREAEQNYDTSLMESILKTVFSLVQEGVKHFGSARVRRSRVESKIAEWEEFKNTFHEMLVEAPTIEGHFRLITAQELEQFRLMPGLELPDGMRYRLRTRPMPARRVPARSR